MSVAKITTFILLWALVVIEIYLISSSIIEKKSQDTEVKNYCEARCAYNAQNMLYEFSGEGIMKGFTTKNECYTYCAQVKQGYVYNILSTATASLGSKILDFLKK